MNRMLRRWWMAGVAMLLLAPALSAVAQERVKKIDIQHVGPPAASDALIRANIRVKEGDLFNRAAVDEDVRTLYNTGFFYNIRFLEDRTADGVNLTYVVQGKPRITEINFRGNKKFSSEKLRKKLSSKIEQPLDEKKLFDDTLAIREKYQKSGYQKTEVKYVLSIDENAGRGTVTFEITETPKVKIIDVVFDNAQAFPQKKLRSTIKTRRTWMFAWLTGAGKLKDEQLDDDKDKLADFYHNEGYIDFNLKDIKYDYATPNRLVLHFLLSEGRRYKVGALAFKGVTLFPTNDILRPLKMKVGSIFTPKDLNKDVESIQDFYGAKGYIDTKISARKIPNVEAGTMDLTFELLEGDKSYIEKIEIKGNVTTKDKVIRRELSVAPGEVFDMVRVKRSKSRLEQMNYFSRVDARPEETDVPNRKNLVVAVDEKRTGDIKLWAGFSSVDSLVGHAEYVESNFDLFKAPTWHGLGKGGGQKFRVLVEVGLQIQNYSLSFIEPWFLNKKLALGVDIYHRDWGYYESLFGDKRASEQRTGMRVSLTRALGSDFLIGSLTTTGERVAIGDVGTDAPATFYDSQGAYLVGRLGGSLAYDTRNNVILPTHGQRSELMAEVVGGDYNLYKAEVRSAWYFPGFSKGHVWEFVGRVGVLDSLGKGIALPDSTLPPNPVPWFERYFLGGPYSLRAWKYRAVGPYETWMNGQGESCVGGNTVYMLSAEYSLPIIDRLRFAVFCDLGNVYYSSYDFDFGDFSADVGAGIRLTVFGAVPLRLDYGFPIRRANREPSGGQFQIGVGNTREL
jgi:outer membrane protein insertion porin family